MSDERICSFCGYSLEEDEEYCSECGNNMEEYDESASAIMEDEELV